MSNRDWLLFVEDILESIGLIEGYAQGMTREQFSALIRNRQEKQEIYHG